MLNVLEKAPPLTVADCCTPLTVIDTLSPLGTREILPERIVVAVPCTMLGALKELNTGAALVTVKVSLTLLAAAEIRIAHIGIGDRVG